MSEPFTIPPADPSDMIALHNVFREALGAAPAYVGSTDPGDRVRVDIVADYYFNVLELLRSHHQGEDEILTPRLLERCPERAADISRIAGQHQEVHASLEDAAEHVAPWRDDPSAQTSRALESALLTLQAGLAPHLSEEEEAMLPLAAQCMNAAEWGEFPAHGLANFKGDKVWLILGLIQEQLAPEHVAMMEANMPPPVVEFWRSQGRDLFVEFVGRLRG